MEYFNNNHNQQQQHHDHQQHQHQQKKQHKQQLRTESNVTPELLVDYNVTNNTNDIINPDVFNFNQQQQQQHQHEEEKNNGGGGGGGNNNNNKIDASLAEFLKDMSITDQNEGIAYVQQQQQATAITQSEEFVQLSQMQRERALHDMHGVNNHEDSIRTNEEVKLSLKEMDDWLIKLQQKQQEDEDNDHNNDAYKLAQNQNPSYVKDIKLRLMFLRSTRYNPELGAKRFIDYLQLKLKLFGLNLLTKPILLSNLNCDTYKFIKLGAMQLLPTRDNAGRAIIVIFPSLFNQCGPSHDNAIRSFFYTMMIALKDISTQSTGFIVVIDACADSIEEMSKPSPSLFMECTKLIKALPIKIQGRHFCTNNNMYGFLGTYISRFHQQSVRIRSRVHVGSHIECMYSLMTFGIPVDRFPTSTDCLGLKVGRHVKFLNVLRILEDKFPFFRCESGIINNNSNSNSKNNGNGNGDDDDNNTNDDLLQSVPLIHQNNQQQQQQQHMTLVVVPSQNDVLFGRGKPIQLHPGNVWLGSIVEDMVPLYYQETSRDGKTSVAQHVVQLIKARGGRFLRPYNHAIDGKKGGGGGGGGKNYNGGRSGDNSSNSSGGCIWIEVDDEKGQEKVCTAFRSCRATQKHKTKNNQQQNNQTQFHNGTDPTTTTSMKNHYNFGQVLRQQQHQQQMNASKRARTYT